MNIVKKENSTADQMALTNLILRNDCPCQPEAVIPCTLLQKGTYFTVLIVICTNQQLAANGIQNNLKIVCLYSCLMDAEFPSDLLYVEVIPVIIKFLRYFLSLTQCMMTLLI